MSPMVTLLAGALVGWAVLILGTTPDPAHRLSVHPPSSRAPRTDGALRRLSGAGGGRSGACVAAVARAVVTRTGHRIGRSRSRRRRQDEVLDLCSTVSAELRAGRPAGTALRTAADVLRPRPGDPLAARGAVHRLTRTYTADADVPALLRAASVVDGWDGLADLAAGWAVVSDTGSPISEVVDRIGDGLRARQQLDREVAVELAGPRATSRLLMALPLLGLALGRGVGADPLQVLLRTPFGRSALAAGCVLMGLGWLWTAALARRAGRT